MFIKYRRSFFLVFMVFLVLFFCQAFSLAVYADDNIVITPTYNGVVYKSSSSVTVYSLTNAASPKNRVFEVSADILNNSSSLSLITDTSLSYKYSYYLCYSFDDLSAVLSPRPSSYTSRTFNSVLVKSGTLYSTDGILDLTQDSYIDGATYYLFLGDYAKNAELHVSPRSVPTPTPISTPTPSPGPSASPGASPGASPEFTPAPTLDDYNFWTYCYDQTIKEGGSSPGTAKLRFVPSSVADFSDAVHNYVYTFNIKIPFRIATNFNGIGYVDANYHFDLDYGIMGVDGYGSASGSPANINKMVDFSNPWIESSDGISFNASLTQQYGYGFDVFNVPLDNGTSQEFYYCFDMYVSLSASGQLTNFADYVDIMLTDITYNNILTTKVSDTQSEDILGQIRDEQAKQDQIENEHYQEEQDKIAEAESSITDGASQLTETLSSWEIFTMPFKIVQDFAGAIASDGSTGLTFPSFTLMGHQLWPSYTFDLQVIAQKFPALYNALHLITGIMVVSWFIHYCWRKWHILIGDDMPEDN